MSEFESTRERQRAEAREGLRREWGDSFDAQLGAAREAFQILTENERDAISEVRLADGRALGDHPDIVRLFAAVGNGAGLTPDEASRELFKLENEEPTKSLLFNSMHPGHAIVMALRSTLHRAKTGAR